MTKKLSLSKALPWLLMIGGAMGLLASLMLMHEYESILRNPNYTPVCNLNPIFSCSTVSNSEQANVFGIYNGYIGIPAYAALMTIGVVLVASAQFKRWLWRLTNLGLLFAVAFVTWLQYETIFEIGALCLFCMVIWAVTIPSFWYLTLYNIDSKNLPLPKSWNKVYSFVRRNHLGFLLLWFLIIIGVILDHFWYYWKTLV